MVECNGIELANGEVIKRITEEGYTYLGVMELDQVMEEEMKKKITKEYYRRLKLVLKSKLNGRNIILAINTWAVAVIRPGAGIIGKYSGKFWRNNVLPQSPGWRQLTPLVLPADIMLCD